MMKKRLHRNIVQAIVVALEEIFEHNKYADRVLDKILKSNPLWGVRDRRQIAETVYDMVRWWRKILHVAAIEHKDSDKYVKALAAWYLIRDEYELPDWMPAIKLSSKELSKRFKDPNLSLAVRESIPDWLEQLGYEELGEQWPVELSALNQSAPLIIRVNTLKMNKLKLIGQLAKINIASEEIDGFPDAINVMDRPNLFRTELFKEGAFEIQDASSQRVAYFAQLEPGMRVIDACAGGGGKSLHMAALMKNKGTIIAMDVEQWKLDELKKRSKRAGVHIIETRLIENNKTIKRLKHSADRVLLDVPCSGLGVLKRNPDAKWKLDLAFVEKLRDMQKKILEDYSQMVKPGGKLIYATCSLLPSENQIQVKQFLEKNNEFELEELVSIMPSEGFDGFFMARMKRKD